MKHLDAIESILILREGKGGTRSERIDQLVAIEKEIFFYQSKIITTDEGDVKKTMEGEWVCITPIGEVIEVTETVIQDFCKTLLNTLMYRYTHHEWKDEQEVWYYFDEDHQVVSVYLPDEFLLGVVRLGIDGKEAQQASHHWQFIRHPLLVSYFTEVYQKDAKKREEEILNERLC